MRINTLPSIISLVLMFFFFPFSRRVCWRKTKRFELFTIFNSFTAPSFKQIFWRALCWTHNKYADSKKGTKACLVALSVCVENKDGKGGGG